jgi:CRISPR-associated Csx11 family protein
MSSLLKKLEDNRTAILLAEIGAYLHLLGRFSEEFIKSQAKDVTNTNSNFDYKNVCNASSFFENTGLEVLLKSADWKPLINITLSGLNELSTNKVNNFCQFIEKHTWSDNPQGLLKILADAHGIVSGIDKALAGRGHSGKQRKAYTFKATVFGYEKEIELLKATDLDDVNKEYIKGVKGEFFKEIKRILDNILQNKSVSYENYTDFINTIKEYFSKTIGETRRPINEISLYDYAHTIASLTKSNLAKVILDGWYEPRGKSQWRILKINLSIIELLSKGLKIGDIFGYRQEIEKIFCEIKKSVEFNYPLGNEIYRDSTGIYFSCPGIEDKDALKTEIISELKSLNQLEFSLQIEISDKSRSMVILASEREESLKEISYPHISFGNIKEESIGSQNDGDKDVCPVCRIRLKSLRIERCKKCEARYQERAQNWIQEPKSTIWLDEVSDHNDCVALIIGQFDLRKWLSGELLNTFVSQTFDEWKNTYATICSRLNIQTISNLKKVFEQLFNNPQNLDNDMKEICKSFIGVKPDNFISDFWEPIAERDATGKSASFTDSSKKAKHLIRLLFRKHPSLARIYRIWETTQDFIQTTIFESILDKYPFGANTPFKELRRKRIKFTIEPNPSISVGATLDIDIEGVRLSPVCVDENKGIFITETNLQILSNKGKILNEIALWMQGKNLKIKRENDNKWQEGYKISMAKPADDRFQDYIPYIKIYEYPDQFMVLVPAYDAFDIAKKILEDYEIQFSKVRDRLPFHIGIIGFHRGTPLYVAMDAGKRLIEAFKNKTETINATIESIEEAPNSKLGNYVKKLTLKCSSYSSVPIIWHISYSTGDPNQEDEWHPYIRFNGDNTNRGNYSFDNTGNGDYVVHVKELKEDDCIKLETSYFNLSFLEKASDRFRIGDDLRPLDEIKRLDDIWNEIQNIVKSKKLGISQLYAYWEEVKKRYENYGENSVWENFVKSSLINILKLSPEEDKEVFNKLFHATKDGLLDICLYWNLQVRKVKPEKA